MPFIEAVGTSSAYEYHGKSRGGGALTLVEAGAPVCVCRDAQQGGFRTAFDDVLREIAIMKCEPARERTGQWLALLVERALRRLCTTSEVRARAPRARPRRGRISSTCARPRR